MLKQNELPKVCFVGRPNVGKSSLFNRMVGRRDSLVLDEPGVTRDVVTRAVNWDGSKLELADLAGLELWQEKRGEIRPEHMKKAEQKEILRKLSIEAALGYLKQADLVLFVVDGRAGVSGVDEELARLVRQYGKNVIPVIAKAEGRVAEDALPDVYALSFGEPMPTSAEHDMGIDDLKGAIIAQLGLAVEESDEEEEAVLDTEERVERGTTAEKPVRLGVYGKPNVGKSTLVNALLGQKRMITSPIAGTTVDTVDSDFVVGERFYRILDTAGIRRRSKTEKGVEVLSVLRALKSLENVDIALLLIDGYEGISDQDEKIAGEIYKAGKPCVIVVNKWDLCGIEKEDYAEKVREALGFMDYAPILFISAERGEGIEPLWDLVFEILEQRMVVAPTPELCRLFEEIESKNNNKNAKFYYASQTSKNPPTINVKVNDPRKVPVSYERFIRHELRARFGWMGSPVKVIITARTRSPSKRQKRTATSDGVAKHGKR